MTKAEPNLITILADLIRHPDAGIQAHSAIALANLTRGSPACQSEAGRAGAVEALLDVCRGRAGNTTGRSYEVHTAGDEAGVSRETTRLGEKQTGASPAIENTTNDGARKQDKSYKPCTQKINDIDSTAVVPDDGVTQMVATATFESGDGNNLGVDQQRDERGGDNLDVDAVQAATAALANLLCYSDANSVRLVDAGGLGVLVGLLSSDRAHNLLDFDQVYRHLYVYVYSSLFTGLDGHSFL